MRRLLRLTRRAALPCLHERAPLLHLHVASRSHNLYVGITSRIEVRMQQHKGGYFEGYSKRCSCNRLVWYGMFQEVGSAIGREKRLKGWTRAKKIALIDGVGGFERGVGIAQCYAPEVRGLKGVRATAKAGTKAKASATAGPSTTLRFAQDDRFGGCEEAGPSTTLLFAQDDRFGGCEMAGIR